MEKSEIKNKEAVAEKISLGALKYSFLKTGIGNDIVFDMEESLLESARKIHCIGIGGIGVSALAQMFLLGSQKATFSLQKT